MSDPADESDADLRAEFAALFPHGWAGPDVLAELALPDTPDARRDCQELVGRCLWDVFSDNHEVVAPDGRKLHLGSHRSAGGFLAELVNAQGGPAPAPRQTPDEFIAGLPPALRPGADVAQSPVIADLLKQMLGDGGYTYLDFTMGNSLDAGRAELPPVYGLIFRRLRDRGMEWVYHFPRLFAVDFRPLRDELEAQEKPEFEGYDPSAELEREADDRRRDEELAELRASLDEGHREAVEAAQDRGPPAVVLAYRAVYGRDPAGWPPGAD